MEPNNNKTLLIIIVFSSFFLFNTAEAACVPRSFHHLNLSPPPHSFPKLQSLSSPRSQPISSPPEEVSPPDHVSAPNPTTIFLPKSMISAPTPATNPPSGSEESAPTTSTTNTPSEPLESNINPAIKKICDTTDYSSLCLSTITPFFTGKTDPISVLEIAIKGCFQHARLALAAIQKIATARDTDSATVTSVSGCEENYSDALDNLQSAMDAIQTRDIGTINSMLSAVITDASTCEDGFAGGDSLMDRFDEKLTRLASNCLAIASLMK